MLKSIGPQLPSGLCLRRRRRAKFLIKTSEPAESEENAFEHAMLADSAASAAHAEHDSRARDIVAASRVMEVIPLLAP